MKTYTMSKRVSFSRKIETRTIDEIDRQSEESRSEEESRQFNKFQLLNLVDGTEAIEKDDDDIDEAIHSNDDDDELSVNVKEKSKHQVLKQVTGNAPKKTRKRKNKRGKGSKRDDKKEAEFDLELVSVDKDDIRNNVNQMYQEYNKHIKLLQVDTRSLLPENELKKIFGKGVIRDDRSRNQGHGGQRSRFVNLRLVDNRQASLFAGPKMEPDDFLNEIQNIKQRDQSNGEKQAVVTNGNGRANKKSSQINNKSVVNSVESLLSSNRPVYFKFVHDREYQAAQKEFVQAVHLAHPEAIVHNISVYPNHAESLLQLSHIIRLSEDYKQASEIIERALVTFERGFHTRFNLATAQCRLSYRRPENRTFFIVLFEQITSCHRRGLRKTPFEYSKLLLSLEPENDPLLATQLLDFFALRCEEYNFLIEFYNSWWQVQKLPNMNFSLAMAYFLKSKCNKQSKVDCDKFLQLANEQLQKSLLLFPNFILPLLEACSGEPSPELKKCTYFDYSPYSNKYKTVPETLEVLIELYVKRSFGLWKQKQTLAWLERNVADLVNKFTSGELEADVKRMSEHWALFKKPAPKNLLRHIALCDLKIQMPASASVSTFLAVDPFPPADAIVTYHSGLHQSNRSTQPTGAGSSIPGLFLRSFFPSFSLSDNQQTEQQRGVATPRPDSRVTTSNQIDTDQEIALGDFVMNELDGAQPGTDPGVDYNALRSSIRNLASSLSDLISLAPLVREHLAGATGQAGRDEASDGNQEQDDEHHDDDRVNDDDHNN